MLSRSSDWTRYSWGTEDPLSSVLLDLRLNGTFFCNSEFDEAWSLRIDARDFASFHFVARGEGCLQVWRERGEPEVIWLGAGDLVLLPRSPRHVFASSKRRSGAAIEDLPARQVAEHASSLRLGKKRGRWLVVCGGVRFESFTSTSLVNLLPEVLVLKAEQASPIVAGALEAMRQESLTARLGGATLMTRLADVVIVEAIRGWLEETPAHRGWLAALRDPQLGRAMAEVHRHPERHWSVDQLARLARLSRSRFSQRFSELMGSAPMSYVTGVRMSLPALERLRGEKLSLAELASSLGYDSVPAFARAFKRHVGRAPGAVRREAQRK